ncbi:MAG: alpha/beta hydrolase [Bacteroidetes bacterium]|nr:MAG: alpha/beta hydrolase [Bacteroidota bacterium]
MEYGTPDKHMNMNSFAQRLSGHIDTTQDFILIGVSLGGMICVELNEILNPKKTIIISSAKNRNELPARYKFQKAIPIYRLFPGGILLAGAKMLQPIVEPDRNKCEDTFKSMLSKKNAVYMKRTVNLIINWDREINTKPIYHIHGTNDHTLPIKKIKLLSYTLDKGSHMMTLTRAKEINNILNAILNDK